METLEPFVFPTDLEGWLTAAEGNADAAIALVREFDARLATAATAEAALGLWNNADLALTGAMNEAYLLSEAHPDAAVRAAAEAAVQKLDAVASARVRDSSLFDALRAHEGADLDDESARFLAHVLRDFRRGGVDLPAEERERVRELADRDTELSLAFSRNIREGRREVRVPAEDLVGLPQDFLDARPADEEGFVTLTTDYIDLMPVREYARVRATRVALVSAYNDLAWPENDEVLSELLAVRAERAQLLGYATWADYETEPRMIGSAAAVRTFLDRLDEVSAAAADAEYPLLLDRLRRDDPDADEVTVADLFYLLSQLRQERHDVDAQLVRSYFSFSRVLPGVLETAARLLDLRFVPVEIPAWHEDVRTYDVFRNDDRLGRVHLDLHPREGKYSHAACFGLVPGVAGRVLPEAVLLCNFSRGLMTHDEVVTFFHEFGHLVHDILGGRQRFVRFSGVATEWDFVEAPSQLLEEWAWDPSVLATFTADAEGEPIPAALVERMQVADGFGRALEVRRQLGHAEVSYRLHVETPGDIAAATERWYRETSPVQPLPGGHSYAGFGHLTGYGSCYYTYQWSLVIARDLRAAFGDDLMNPAVAERYRREILEPGGSRDGADLVQRFLGRPYTFDAYRQWLSGN